MKKAISVILLLLMIFMLEFNWLKGIMPELYVWFESFMAFAILIALIWWNGLAKKMH